MQYIYASRNEGSPVIVAQMNVCAMPSIVVYERHKDRNVIAVAVLCRQEPNEVISINPNAPQPNRPRWFQLDEPDLSQLIRLATWIARTNDIVAALTASIPLGDVEPMSRGQMNWLITIPADGSLPLHGIAPALIQWTAGVHPAAALHESGCTLVRLEGFHPEARKVISVLESIGFEGDFRVFALPPDQKPYLVARIQTPTGILQLSAPNFSLNPDVRHRDHMKSSI
ncbi:MAG: VOC family protein [Methylococcales bacterium]|nr:VOC family protein [Methylococcales bacterium]